MAVSSGWNVAGEINDSINLDCHSLMPDYPDLTKVGVEILEQEDTVLIE